MMVTLNGELLLNSRGSELAVKDFNKSDGEFSLIIFHSVLTFLTVFSLMISRFSACL